MFVLKRKIKVVPIRVVQQCPVMRMDARHYRKDGTCRCKRA